MSNSKVRAEFDSRLSAWASSQAPAVPVAFQNDPFTKPTDGSPYLEPLLIPNAPINRDVAGKRKTYIGIYQINCWVKTGSGMGKVEQLAQSIANLFPMLPKTGPVSVEQTPSIEHPIPDGYGWMAVPVTVKYRMESF